MKKTFTLMAMLACCAGMTPTTAQAVVNASVETGYPTENGDNVRLCVNPADGASIIYYRDVDLDKNCFVYHVPGASSDNKYIWPDIPEGTGSADCTVEDMVVVHDTFYFCGTATYPDNRAIYRKKGYMGWVKVSHLKNASGTVDFNYYSSFCDISKPTIHVVELTHMDGSFEAGANNKPIIGLVGKVQNAESDTMPCLLLVKDSSGVWYYQFHYLTDTKETFTDIAFIHAKWLLVPSRFEHENDDHYRFGIRHEALSVAFGMASSPLTAFQGVQKFNTQYLVPAFPATSFPTWHRSDVEIHMAEDPSCSGRATLAYECEDTSIRCENRQLTALYKLDISNIAINNIAILAAQLVHGYFRYPYTLVGIHHVNATGDSTIALLHTGIGADGEMASTLLFPTWSHFGQIDGLLADYRSNTSLDVFKSQFIRLGGDNPGRQ